MPLSEPELLNSNPYKNHTDKFVLDVNKTPICYETHTGMKIYPIQWEHGLICYIISNALSTKNHILAVLSKQRT